MELTGKQKSHLRALGHALSPVVQLGKEGVTEGVVGAVNQALTDHELIKVKVSSDSPDSRHDVASALAQQTKSHVAQVIGGVVLLYRRHPNKPEIKLPPAKS